MSETVPQMTDFAKLQRWAHENYVDLLPGEWMGYHRKRASARGSYGDLSPVEETLARL